MSLRGVPRSGATKQSSWIATARLAHLAMTVIFLVAWRRSAPLTGAFPLNGIRSQACFESDVVRLERLAFGQGYPDGDHSFPRAGDRAAARRVGRGERRTGSQ